MTVLSKFSKGISNSRAISFSLSESKNCDSNCKMLKNGCYAKQPERQYKHYRKKLVRHHKTLPSNLIYKALGELMAMKKPVSFFRVSVSGSLPKRSQLSNKNWRLFGKSFKDLVNYLNSVGANTHIPVESMDKARSYRAMLKGTGVTVRRSVQDRYWRRSLLKSRDAVSYVVEKEQDSQEIMKACRDNNLTVVNCAAIKGVSQSGKQTLCGICKSCSDSRVDIVLYEKH